jgi:hypothetical protein
MVFYLLHTPILLFHLLLGNIMCCLDRWLCSLSYVPSHVFSVPLGGALPTCTLVTKEAPDRILMKIF